jgi:SAM-dependent methyltransferase
MGWGDPVGIATIVAASAPLSGAIGHDGRMSDPGAYGEAFADVYDQWYHDVTDAEATARFVAERCRSGLVVEVGVGTGRLAGPLVEQGLRVVGVDASVSMLDRCRARGLGPRLQLVRADMAAMPLAATDRARGRAPVGVVLVAFNTLFNLTTEGGQRAVFDQAASLLDPEGVLITETLDAEAFDHQAGTSLGIREIDDRGLTVVATEVDPVVQTIVGRHVAISGSGVRVRPWTLRWSTADQLDGYATAAGLELVERYPSWAGPGAVDGPTTGVHVSVYRPDPGTGPEPGPPLGPTPAPDRFES